MSDTTGAVLAPDKNETVSFLRLLYGDKPDLCFQVFKNREDCTHPPGFRYSTLRDAWRWLTEANRAGAGCYFMVNRGDGKDRSANAVKEVRAYFVDLDGTDPEPLWKSPVPPHIVTESSPGRFQAFWRAEKAALETFSDIQHALSQRFNSDPAIKDLSRVMRLPGFYHMKRDPFLCRVLDSSDGPLVAETEFIEALGLQLPKKTLWIPTEEIDEEDCFLEGGRHQCLLKVVGKLKFVGLMGEALFNGLQEVNLRRCVPPLPESEVRGLAQWCAKKNSDFKMSSNVRPISKQVEEAMPYKGKLEYESWAKIKTKKFPLQQWIVVPLLSEGVTILAGKQKAGKSWLALYLAYSVASGALALGHMAVNQGAVLYLGLEDNYARFHARIGKIGAGDGWLDNAYFANEWPKGRHASDGIARWCEDVKAKDQVPRLVVVDTLAKTRESGGFRNESIYDKDYAEISTFCKVCREHGLAVVLVHHLRKADGEDTQDAVSGSAGLTGAADSVWIFERGNRDEMKARLTVSGRDVLDWHYDLHWDTTLCRWQVDPEGVPKNRREVED